MEKEKQYYEEISDAFLALKDIDDDEIEGMLREDRKKKERQIHMSEGKAFSVQTGSRDLEAARSFLDEEADSEDEIEVIDVDADSVDHLKKNSEYIGQGILCCNRCKANRFIDMDLLVASEADDEVYNIEDECPHCHDSGAGYSLVGQVGKVQKDEAEEAPTEEETDNAENETEAEVENDTKAEDDEATFDNDLEEEPEAEETSEEDAEPEAQEEEEPEVDTLEEEPEKDGMETDTSEDELDDLDLPALGDEVDSDDTKEDEDNVKESLNEEVQLNALAEEAWMMNRVISSMNNEDAYYGSWLYIWPDGESRDACAYDFGDQESFDELEETFLEVYKYYHADGLYDATPEVLEYAHKTDSKLGLSKIENIEAAKPRVTESYECAVAGDVFRAITSPEKIDKIIILDVSDDEAEPRTVFKGTKEDLPVNVVGSPCRSFDVADGYLSCNIDSDVKNTNRPLSKALECFNDDKTEKVLIWDQATGDEVFSGTKADACNKFGNCEFISFETPAVVRICINNPSLTSCAADDETETNLDKLIKKIIDANNLSQYKTDKPNTNEYWIKNSLELDDDVELIYESFVKPLNDKRLTRQFKQVTGYNNPLEEAYEAGFAAARNNEARKARRRVRNIVAEDVSLDQVKTEVDSVKNAAEKPEDKTTNTAKAPEKDISKAKNESFSSFKTRKELAEAVNECKNNSKPYTIRRSVKEGFRYDLIMEDANDAALIPASDDDVEFVANGAQNLPAEYSRNELAFMNEVHRIAADIADAIKRYYDIDANPALIVADILQDLKLISGEISPDDLPDNLVNNVTKKLFSSYNQFYELVDDLLSAVTGETIHTTSEQKLMQAKRLLHSNMFSQQTIDMTIGSTAFVNAVQGGNVPFISPEQIDLIGEAFEKRNAEENIEFEVCEKCGKSPCECVDEEDIFDIDLDLEEATQLCDYDECIDESDELTEARKGQISFRQQQAINAFTGLPEVNAFRNNLLALLRHIHDSKTKCPDLCAFAKDHGVDFEPYYCERTPLLNLRGNVTENNEVSFMIDPGCGKPCNIDNLMVAFSKLKSESLKELGKLYLDAKEACEKQIKQLERDSITKKAEEQLKALEKEVEETYNEINSTSKTRFEELESWLRENISSIRVDIPNTVEFKTSFFNITGIDPDDYIRKGGKGLSLVDLYDENNNLKRTPSRLPVKIAISSKASIKKINGEIPEIPSEFQDRDYLNKKQDAFTKNAFVLGILLRELGFKLGTQDQQKPEKQVKKDIELPNQAFKQELTQDDVNAEAAFGDASSSANTNNDDVDEAFNTFDIDWDLEEDAFDVDTDFFDDELREYFNEAYDDTVLYTTTKGYINSDSTIVLEGLIQSNDSIKPVQFTLTPENKIQLTESVEDKKTWLDEVLKSNFIVTNNMSEEKFEFKFSK